MLPICFSNLDLKLNKISTTSEISSSSQMREGVTKGYSEESIFLNVFP